MAVEINDIGNGVGYLYIADASLNILTAEVNTPQGERNIRASGLTVSPYAARKSAVGTVTVTNATASGSITAVNVNGVNQIASSIPIASTDVAVVAQTIVDAINSFTPLTGFDYTAVANGGVVSIIAPSDVGSGANGYVVAVTKNGSSTFTTTNMAGGSSNGTIIDDILGLRFFMHADVSATPSDLSGSVEITKYMVMRGLQTGMVVSDLRISNDGLYDIDRSCTYTLINVTPQSGSSDVLAYIDPVDFVDGDIVMVRSGDPTKTIYIESAPVSTSTAPVKNIYLCGDLTFTADSYQTLTLQYRYIESVGACFVEATRSLSVVNSFNIYNTDGSLTNDRTVDGNGYSLSIGNNTMPHLYVNVTNSFEVLSGANIVMTADPTTGNYQVSGFNVINSGANGLYGFSAYSSFGTKNNTDSVHARVESGNGILYLNVTDHIEIYQGTTLIYKLPTTKPTNGQVLTALDSAGTLGWA